MSPFEIDQCLEKVFLILDAQLYEGARKPPARSRPPLKSPGGAENAGNHIEKRQKKVNKSPPPNYSPPGAPGSSNFRLKSPEKT